VSTTAEQRPAPAGARTISDILEAARCRLVRVSPVQAAAEVARGGLSVDGGRGDQGDGGGQAGQGGVLVDIRPAAQRAVEGEIPGAVIIERNVLEWRLDPQSDHRLPLAHYGLRVIVFCSEGYTSSLAAASLLDLGLHRATDLEGGFKAWRAAGLPTS
jgi:rhodanese-related sulfurtransferase